MGSVVDDFVVDKTKVPLCVKYKEKIEKLFGVNVTFGCVARDVDSAEKQWIGLQGESSNRRNAKEYVIALCHPEDRITMRYPVEMDSLVSNRLLEKIEGQTHAAITLESNCQVSISGLELAVTLAMSAIEDVIQKSSLEGLTNNRETSDPNDENPKKARKEKRLSSEATLRLDTCFERALSQHSDGTCTPKDYEHAPDAVKRVMLQCWSEDSADSQAGEIARNLYHYQCNGELPVTVTADVGPAHPGQTVTDGPSGSITQRPSCVTSLGSQVHQINLAAQSQQTLQQQATKQQALSEKQSIGKPNAGFDLKNFARQCGYLDHDIDTVLASGPPNMTPKDFLAKLYENKSKQAESAVKNVVETDGHIPVKRGSHSEIITSKNELKETDVSGSVSTTSEVLVSRNPKPAAESSNPQYAHAASYWERLAQDFHEEDDCTNIEELKQRNRERQDMLKAHFRQGYPQPNQEVDLASTSASAQARGTKAREPKQPRQKRNYFSKKGKKNGSGSPSPKLSHQTDKSNGKGAEIIDLTTECDMDCVLDRDNTDETCLMKVWQQEEGVKFLGQFDPRSPSVQRGRAFEGQETYVDGAARRGTPPIESSQLRHIVIDGSNVAMSHGNGKAFSCPGIQICVDYFLKRGHTEVTAFVPQWRQRAPTYKYPIKQQELLEKLKDMGHLVFTPARKVEGKHIVCYDDRYVLKLAEQTDGIIVSNDNYRDLMTESPGWKKMIQERLLMYSFARDIFMPPDDPLGREGPTLDEFLLKPGSVVSRDQQHRIHSPAPNQRTGKPLYNHKQSWDTARLPSHQQNYNQQHHQPNHSQQQQNYSQPQQQQQHHQPWQQKKQKSGPARSQAETDHLCTLLRSLFPSSEQEVKIRTVLENHPWEKNLNKLSNYVMNICN